MRKVIVVSSALNKARVIETDVKTWGELKQNREISDFLSSNVEAILSPDNVTLSRDEAVIPDVDCKIFLVPTKNKAGIDRMEAQSLGIEITEAIYKASQLSSANKVQDLKENLIETIEEFFDVDLEDTTDELQQALREAKRFED